MTRYVIIDTSSMLFGFSYNRNVFEAAKLEFRGLTPLVSKGIIRELERISMDKGKKGQKARIALLELKAKKIDVDNITTYPDSWILDASVRNRGSVVITNDTALAEKLLLEKVKVYKVSRSGILKLFKS